VLGGGELHLRELSRGLAARGLACTVVTRRSERSFAPREQQDGVDVVRVAPWGPARIGKYLMVPGALAAIAGRRARFDVLVVRGTRVLGLPGFLVARALGKRVVLQPEINGEMSGEAYWWGTPLATGWPRRVLELAVRARNRLLCQADAGVAMSREIAREFAAAGLPAERIELLPHGIDIGRFRPVPVQERRALREALGLPVDGLVVTYCGRLLRGKGLELLLEAFARVGPGRGAHLLLLGSGAGQSLSVEEALRFRAAQPPLAGRVRFAGRVDDVERWLQASDVFAFPSEFEALGLALLEASSCGLPVLATRTGGIPDVVEDGLSGVLVEVGDGAALVAGLERLLDDPALRHSMGQHGRRIAQQRFDAAAALDRYQALFERLSSSGSPPRPATPSAGSPACAPRAGAAHPR
jgi:glycosyltransferase involved in cell wall biosynthesis